MYSEHAEDQQRINSFSQLNNRLRHIEGKLEDLKVSLHICGHRSHELQSCDKQQEREALDDLSSELMMSDEDVLVLCALNISTLYKTIFTFILDTKSEKRFCTCLIHVLSNA